MDKLAAQALAIRFSKATIDYWMEWLKAHKAVPPDHFALIDFITEQEEYIGDSLNETIPHDWKQD